MAQPRNWREQVARSEKMMLSRDNRSRKMTAKLEYNGRIYKISEAEAEKLVGTRNTALKVLPFLTEARDLLNSIGAGDPLEEVANHVDDAFARLNKYLMGLDIT